MLHTNWKIGERVISRHLGPSTYGTITDFITYEFINQPVPQWDNRYPRWRDSLVAIVKYDEPVFPVRKDECPSDAEYEDMVKSTPPFKSLTIPVDDLIFLSGVNNGSI